MKLEQKLIKKGFKSHGPVIQKMLGGTLDFLLNDKSPKPIYFKIIPERIARGDGYTGWYIIYYTHNKKLISS